MRSCTCWRWDIAMTRSRSFCGIRGCMNGKCFAPRFNRIIQNHNSPAMPGCNSSVLFFFANLFRRIEPMGICEHIRQFMQCGNRLKTFFHIIHRCFRKWLFYPQRWHQYPQSCGFSGFHSSDARYVMRSEPFCKMCRSIHLSADRGNVRSTYPSCILW